MRRQLIFALALVVVFVSSHRLRGVQNDAPAAPAAAPAVGNLAELRQARVEIATKALEQIERLREAGAEEASLKERGEWQARLAHAEFEAAGNDRAARLAAAE